MTKYVRFEKNDATRLIVINKRTEQQIGVMYETAFKNWLFEGLDQDELTEILAKLKELNGGKK